MAWREWKKVGANASVTAAPYDTAEEGAGGEWSGELDRIAALGDDAADDSRVKAFATLQLD